MHFECSGITTNSAIPKDVRIVRVHATILIAAILALTATSASGTEVNLGAQITGVRNALTGELPKEGKWKGRGTLGAGLIAELSLTEDVTLSFQPSFTPRHSRQQFEWLDEVIGHIDYDFDYLSLPLIVRVTGDPIGIRGFVTAGMDFGILLDATMHTETGSEDIKDELNSTTIGALFGAGAMVPLGRNYLTFELRYVQGLEDIVARDGTEPEPGLGSPSVKYRGFVLMAGFLFTLGSE